MLHLLSFCNFRPMNMLFIQQMFLVLSFYCSFSLWTCLHFKQCFILKKNKNPLNSHLLRRRKLYSAVHFYLTLLNTNISGRVQSQNFLLSSVSTQYLHQKQWIDRQTEDEPTDWNLQHESCSLQRIRLKNRELWINDSNQLLAAKATGSSVK